MQFHQLKRIHPNKKSVQVGRGGKRGKTSGRGGKGQTARAGHKVRPEMRDIIKRLPKLRGRGKHIFQSFRPRFVPVNLRALERHFEAGETVTAEALQKKGLISPRRGARVPVKILGDGELTKALIITGCALSASARAKVEKGGGSILKFEARNPKSLFGRAQRALANGL